MTEHDFEQRLRSWFRDEVDQAEVAPSALRHSLSAMASDGRRDMVDSRRWLLLAAATLMAALLVGGAIAVASGWVRLSLVVPPALDATLITPPASPPPSTSPSVSPAPTPDLTPVAIGSGSWSVTSPPHHRGCCGTATLLRDGRVLFAGGAGEDGRQPTKAELYDPATGQWTETGRMHVARLGPVASLLADGRVLVAGGRNGLKGLASAELYDPTSGTWTETGSMPKWRYYSRAISLADGRVLVLGGIGRTSSSPRIPPGGGRETKDAATYDPKSGTWSRARSMSAPPRTATLLPDGTVLVTHDGGSAELFDPRTGRWTATASPMPPLHSPEATVLASGDVLLLDMWDRPTMESGLPGKRFVGAAVLYDPRTGSWTPTGSPPSGAGTAALLADGIALVFGADGAARYDPQSGSWATVAAPSSNLSPGDGDEAPNWDSGDSDGSARAACASCARSLDIAIRLLDGRILAVGRAGTALFDPSGSP